MAFPTIPTGGRVLTANQADTSATRTFPSLSSLTKNPGDLLIAGIITYQNGGTADANFSAWGGGFTEFYDQDNGAGTMSVGLAYKYSTGSETGTFTVTQAATVTGHASMFLISIPGASATPPEAGGIAWGTTAAADPAALDPAGWAAEDTLWISLIGSGMTSATGSWTGTDTTAPTNYSNRVDSNTTDSSTVGQTELAIAFRQLNASSENIGTGSVDTSNSRNVALAIAVRPITPVEQSFTANAHIKGTVSGTFTADAHIYVPGDNAYEDEVFADSPVFLATMEEASGNLTDIIGSKTGTVNGSPTYGVTGPINGKTAIDMAAVTDFFDFADHADLDLGDGPFSIELWYRRDEDTGAIATLLHKGTDGYMVAVTAADQLVLDKVGLAGYLVGESGTTPADGTWHHIVITRSAAGAGNTLVYKDGVESHTDSQPAVALADTTSVLRLGQEASSNRIGGALAYVALYKSALSSTRIAAHYNAATGSVVSGSFTADAHIKSTISGSFTANSNIRKNDIAGTFTADAYIRQTFASTFTADAYIKKTIAGTFTADSNIRRNDIAGTFTADAYIKQTFTSSFAADAFIRQTIAGSLTADAYIKNTIAGSFTANANIKNTIAGTWTADAFVKRLDIAGSFTADAYVRQTFSGSVTADAYIRQTFASTFTGNANIKATVGGTLTADSYIKNTLSGSFSADAQIANVVAGSFTSNAYIKNTLAGAFTADSYIRATAAGTFAANALIRQTYSGTLTADAYILNVYSGSWTADAYVRRTFNQTVTADAHIKSTVGGTFTADATIAVTGVVTGSFTADANIRRNGIESTLTADAYIRQTFSGTFTADAYVMRVTTGAFTADAHIEAASAVTYNGSFTADAYVRNTMPGSFSASAHIRRLDIPGSVTADAYIKKTLAGSFVADAYVHNTLAGFFSAEAYIRQTLVGSFTADAFISKITSATFTADAYLRGSISGTFIADAWVYNPNAVTRLNSNPSKAGLMRSTQSKSLAIGSDATAKPVYLTGRTSKHG